MNDRIKKYTLSGGGLALIIKPFGDDVYIALIKMNGRYPEPGRMARNWKREEYVFVIEGRLKISLNGREETLEENGSLMLEDGAVYSIEGSGRALVAVKDGPGGETIIE